MGKKKVVMCASASLEKEILSWKQKLEEDFDLIKYPEKLTGDFLPGYEKEFTDHYKSIVQTDILFILNVEKKGIPGYIGPGVFAEIGFAVGLNRSLDKNIEIICLNHIPDSLAYSEELKFWETLGWIKFRDEDNSF